MSNQISFMAIKPGFEQKPKIVEYIEDTLNRNGCKIVKKVQVQYTLDQAMDHYSVIPAKFQTPAATYLSSAPITAYILEDFRPKDDKETDFISYVRSLQGDTRCQTEGTIRHTVVNFPIFAADVEDVRSKFMDKEKGIDEITTNIVHASDSPQNLVREVNILLASNNLSAEDKKAIETLINEYKNNFDIEESTL